MTEIPSACARATHVILPGVGAAAAGMTRLALRGSPRSCRRSTQPVLGICLGMQLLFEGSEEGRRECLGVIPGACSRLPQSGDLPVPHMGWNELDVVASSALLTGVAPGDVRLLRAQLRGAGRRLHARRHATTACRSRPSSQQGNFCGTQFHPERSARVGARVLANFLKMLCN